MKSYWARSEGGGEWRFVGEDWGLSGFICDDEDRPVQDPDGKAVTEFWCRDLGPDDEASCRVAFVAYRAREGPALTGDVADLIDYWAWLREKGVPEHLVKLWSEGKAW